MTQSQKQILDGVVAMLQTTLGDMPARKADEVVAACIKILQNIP